MDPVKDALSRVLSRVKNTGAHVVHTSEISRRDRELLLQRRWLEEIIRGWYYFIRPDLAKGDSTAWFACFWDFLRVYLAHHFDTNYCLSAESSLDLHAGSTIVPKQVIVMAVKGSGTALQLPFGTSLLVYSDPDRIPKDRTLIQGLQAMPLEYALCKVSPTYFRVAPQEAELALRLLRDPNTLLKVIAEHNFKTAAGRLIGAYTFLKETKMADTLKRGLELIGVRVDEVNPFERTSPFLKEGTFLSPYVARIKVMWERFREIVISHFPVPPGLPKDKTEYMNAVTAIYSQDAYNSLSIEGYRVTEELIEKVKRSEWNPELTSEDNNTYNALAARGYYEAHLLVEESVRKILEGDNPGRRAKEDLHTWYQSMFAPMVRAGIFSPADLFGYRRNGVYIRNSRHTPPSYEYVPQCMDALFELLEQEDHAGVRAVLGHFIFVFIHPFMDGNGRIGRFLMNAMFASGGYPWTIIHLSERDKYMAALEAASVDGNILPFTKFLAQQVAQHFH